MTRAAAAVRGHARRKHHTLFTVHCYLSVAPMVHTSMACRQRRHGALLFQHTPPGEWIERGHAQITIDTLTTSAPPPTTKTTPAKLTDSLVRNLVKINITT